MNWSDSQHIRTYHAFFNMMMTRGFDVVECHNQAVHMTEVFNRELIVPPQEGV